MVYLSIIKSFGRLRKNLLFHELPYQIFVVEVDLIVDGVRNWVVNAT